MQFQIRSLIEEQARLLGSSFKVIQRAISAYQET